MARLSPSWKRSAKLFLKAVVAVLVLWAVGRHVERTWNDLKARHETLRVEPGWVVAGGVLYLAGLSACGMFYGQVLRASATPLGTGAALRAYLISQLGKYVPGKAMVVVMRVGLSSPYGARPATAAIATFYETLVMMAAGAVVAALGFTAARPAPWKWKLVVLSAGLALAFLVVVDPIVFPRASRLVTSPIPGVGPEAEPRFTRRLLGAGLLWSLACWVLLGLSQVAVIRAVDPGGVRPGLWPVVAASVALATVGGFVVAVLPGGLGVREGLLMATLGRVLGSAETAVIATLLLRLTWVAAEGAAAAVLAVVRPARGRLSEPPPTPNPTP
jgi:glycosyltransferase 2 family protein